MRTSGASLASFSLFRTTRANGLKAFGGGAAGVKRRLLQNTRQVEWAAVPRQDLTNCCEKPWLPPALLELAGTPVASFLLAYRPEGRLTCRIGSRRSRKPEKLPPVQRRSKPVQPR